MKKYPSRSTTTNRFPLFPTHFKLHSINLRPFSYIKRKELPHLGFAVSLRGNTKGYESPVQVRFPSSYVITERDHLCQWQLLSGRIGAGVANVGAPPNAVELDVDTGDLLPIIDVEDIDSLDRHLFASDSREAPVPDNIVSRHEDLDGLSPSK